MPACYQVSVDEADPRELKRQLGLFRFIAAAENRSWAILCNEWYNLFAGSQDLVEALLGDPVEKARQEFLEFASPMAKGNADEPLMPVARHYATLQFRHLVHRAVNSFYY